MSDTFNILVLSKTSLMSSHDFRTCDYDYIHMDSTSSQVRSMAILIKNPIVYSVLNLSIKLDTSLEIISIQLNFNSITLNIFGVYRHPNIAVSHSITLSL